MSGTNHIDQDVRGRVLIWWDGCKHRQQETGENHDESVRIKSCGLGFTGASVSELVSFAIAECEILQGYMVEPREKTLRLLEKRSQAHLPAHTVAVPV